MGRQENIIINVKLNAAVTDHGDWCRTSNHRRTTPRSTKLSRSRMPSVSLLSSLYLAFSKSRDIPFGALNKDPTTTTCGALISSTLSIMTGRANLSSAFVFDTENTYQKATLAHLYRSSSIIKVASLISAPPPEVRVFLRDLASAANSTANENACGSVLAGQASEADEFGDICVWLGIGPYSEGHEANILRALNLSDSTRRARYRPRSSFPGAHLSLVDNCWPAALTDIAPSNLQGR